MKKTSWAVLTSFLIFVMITGAIGYVLTRPKAFGDAFHSYFVNISGDGNYIIASEIHGRLAFFSKSIATPLWVKNMTLDRIAELSADGKYIACGYGTSIYLIRNNGETAWTNSSSSRLRTVAISDNGDYIVAGTSSRVYFFTRQDNVPRWSYSADGVPSVAISADGNYVVAVTGKHLDNLDMGWVGGRISLFSYVDNTSIWSYSGASIRPRISSNGRYLAFTDLGDRLFVYDRVENALVVNLWSHDTIFGIGVIGSMSMSSDGNYIALGVYNFGPSKGSGFVALFSVSENRVVWVY